MRLQSQLSDTFANVKNHYFPSLTKYLGSAAPPGPAATLRVRPPWAPAAAPGQPAAGAGHGWCAGASQRPGRGMVGAPGRPAAGAGHGWCAPGGG